MRRRRHVIQVSTFPFLAVLLCTMGSLILLLLVIDKRAKAVARIKLVREIAERKKSSVEDEKANQEEWERQLRNLHALLRSQLDDVRGEADAVHGRLNATAAELSSTQSNQWDLKNRLAAEKDFCARTAAALAARKSELAHSEQQDAATEAQRRQMTVDLAILERTLEQLKIAKRLESQTFSLVPYKGRRGDNRKPLYLECTGDGWVFHPDRKSIEATHNAGAELHAELEHRLKPSTDSSAYVFLLVRPDGITNYYHALSAMRGLEVAYGYEFVDKTWVLDFSGNPEGPPQPWKNDDTPPVTIATGPSSSAPRKAARQPWIFREGLGASSTIAGGVGSQNGGSEIPTGGSRSPSIQMARGGMSPGSNYEDTGRSPRGSVSQWPGKSSNGDREGAPASGIRVGLPGGGLGNGNAGPENPFAGPFAGGADTPGVGLGTAKAEGSESGSPSLGPPKAGADPNEAIAGRTGDPSRPRTGTGQRDDSRRNSQVPYPGETAVPANPGSMAHPENSAFSTARNGDSATSGSESASRRGTQGGGNGAEGAGERPAGGLDGSTFPVSPRRGANSADKPKPFHLTGNRDWFIPLVCTPDAIVLPSGAKIAATALVKDEGAKALTKAIQDIIGRKQATVREGEPPYRPQIRFLVHPEGLRLYHTAYPILEPLQVPILRQNVEPEDANPSATGVRQP